MIWYDGSAKESRAMAGLTATEGKAAFVLALTLT